MLDLRAHRRMIPGHRQTLSGTDGHHRTPTDIIGHRQTSSDTNRHHRTPTDIIGHQQTSSDTYRHHRTLTDTSCPPPPAFPPPLRPPRTQKPHALNYSPTIPAPAHRSYHFCACVTVQINQANGIASELWSDSIPLIFKFEERLINLLLTRHKPHHGVMVAFSWIAAHEDSLFRYVRVLDCGVMASVADVFFQRLGAEHNVECVVEHVLTREDLEDRRQETTRFRGATDGERIRRDFEKLTAVLQPKLATLSFFAVIGISDSRGKLLHVNSNAAMTRVSLEEVFTEESRKFTAMPFTLRSLSTATTWAEDNLPTTSEQMRLVNSIPARTVVVSRGGPFFPQHVRAKWEIGLRASVRSVVLAALSSDNRIRAMAFMMERLRQKRATEPTEEDVLKACAKISRRRRSGPTGLERMLMNNERRLSASRDKIGVREDTNCEWTFSSPQGFGSNPVQQFMYDVMTRGFLVVLRANVESPCVVWNAVGDQDIKASEFVVTSCSPDGRMLCMRCEEFRVSAEILEREDIYECDDDEIQGEKWCTHTRAMVAVAHALALELSDPATANTNTFMAWVLQRKKLGRTTLILSERANLKRYLVTIDDDETYENDVSEVSCCTLRSKYSTRLVKCDDFRFASRSFACTTIPPDNALTISRPPPPPPHPAPPSSTTIPPIISKNHTIRCRQSKNKGLSDVTSTESLCLHMRKLNDLVPLLPGEGEYTLVIDGGPDGPPPEGEP